MIQLEDDLKYPELAEAIRRQSIDTSETQKKDDQFHEADQVSGHVNVQELHTSESVKQRLENPYLATAPELVSNQDIALSKESIDSIPRPIVDTPGVGASSSRQDRTM